MGNGLSGTDQTWERLARTDPYWAILSDPAKRRGGWDESEFFATGEREVEALLEYLGRIVPRLGRERALDFGCGVGRVTRPLASHFTHVTGMDVSPTMVKTATSLVQRNDDPRGSIEFVVNTGPGLEKIANGHFDLVYSTITLQHIPSKAALHYVAEFIRTLKPGGLAVFQLPARRRATLKSRVGSLLPRKLRAQRHSGIEMYGVPRGEVLTALALAGGEVVDVQRDHLAGPEWESYRYAVVKR